MQTQLTNRNTETTNATARSRRLSSFLQIAEARWQRRKIRISLPRRESCLTKQKMLAALREAEFADWQASGGDFLNSMHQPVHYADRLLATLNSLLTQHYVRPRSQNAPWR